MLQYPYRFYPSTQSKKKEWYAPFTMQSIRNGEHVMIWDDVMSYTKVHKTELQLMESLKQKKKI